MPLAPHKRARADAWRALTSMTCCSETSCTSYRHAQEVGGDFFQIIPHKTEGSLPIVAGDVTGKGLKAGLLAALLVRPFERRPNQA
jgi:hypothetical protein